MSGVFYFNQFQLDVLHSRLSSKQPVPKEEAGAIANFLEVEEIKVYQWFRNKPSLKIPQVDIETKIRTELLLSEASNEAYNGVDYRGPRRLQWYRLKRLQYSFIKQGI